MRDAVYLEHILFIRFVSHSASATYTHTGTVLHAYRFGVISILIFRSLTSARLKQNPLRELHIETGRICLRFTYRTIELCIHMCDRRTIQTLSAPRTSKHRLNHDLTQLQPAHYSIRYDLNASARNVNYL